MNGTDIKALPFINTSFTFTGREWDSESEIFYYRARYYDPSIGRFLQVDPDPGKVLSPISVINRYIYTGNSPISRIDPSGRNFWDIAIAIAVIAAAVYTGGAAGAFLGGAVGGALGGGTLGAVLGAAAGIAAGAIVGGVTGAVIGSLSYTWLGRNEQEGAMKFGILGALAGGVAGGFDAITGHSGGLFNKGADYLAKQFELATEDTVRYFFDLSYDKSPLFGNLLGGGYAGPSLGGTAIYSGITFYFGDPKQPEVK